MARLNTWLKNTWRSNGKCRNVLQRQYLAVMRLEARALPATFTVTNLADSGGGSLRQAILNANGVGGQDLINFQAGVTGTIPLLSSLAITDSVVINGPGAELSASAARAPFGR